MSVLARAIRMRKSYDFSKATKNPYSHMLKRSITIRLDEETIAYFKRMAQAAGVPYQTLINLYLRDCAASGRKLRVLWDEPTGPASTA
jgi:predicted DNA binding CopG/RHH family protein